MTGATTILLLRHAESTWNREGRWQGWADPPLTTAGAAAAATWTMSVSRPLNAVVSSDLLRARHTARLIAARLSVGLEAESAAFREQDQGEWTGLTRSEIKDRWPVQLKQRPRHPVGGETEAAVLARAQRALRELAHGYPGGTVLVITHSRLIRVLDLDLGGDGRAIAHLEGRWIVLREGALTLSDPETRVSRGRGPSARAMRRPATAASAAAATDGT